MRADLHIHSTASDGTLSPQALVELAAGNGVDVIALADHDSISGIAAAASHAAAFGITVIPAVELSAASDDRSVHILGYFLDTSDRDLQVQLDALRRARVHRAASIVELLRQAGYAISLEQVLELSQGGAVGRTHVARTLVSAGHASDVSDAFERLVGRGKPFYLPKDLMTPLAAVSLITRAGGLAVLAHPGVSGAEDLVGELVGHGLAGIEAYHVDHTPEQRARLVEIAAEYGLLVTGGTDYHSPDAPHPDLGQLDFPERDVRAFLAAGTHRVL